MKMMMRKVSCVVALVLLVAVALGGGAEAVTCNPMQLSPCMAAITSSAPPSSACCAKVREQRPCLCGYLKNPNLRQYVNSPNARRVASTCGVPFPNC